ncbi:MAG TPA: MFS transporter [Burkholderiaceae bacterium]|nr:MFS transporter [Burkholderiaceae bacterium]
MSHAAPQDAAPGGLRGALLGLLTAFVCVHASMAATRVTAMLLIIKQGQPQWMVGGLLSLYAVAPILLSLWAGRLADRHGFHRPVAVGLGMAFTGACTALVSQHVAALALASLLSGGAIAVAAVAIQREAGLLARSAGELKRVFSWVALGPAVSNSLSPVISGLLIDHLGYGAGFAFAALLPLLAMAAATRIPRTPHLAGAQEVAHEPAWTLLRIPALRNLLIVNMALSSSWDAHTFAMPIIGHLRGLSASSIGFVLGAFAVAATAVRLTISTWTEHFDEMLALRAAMAVTTAVLAVYAWLPGMAGLLCGSAVLGLALGAVQPMVLATLHQATPTARHGQALGLRMLCTNGMTIFLPLCFGMLSAATSPAAPLWLMALLVVAAQWPAAQVRRQVPQPVSA